MKSNKVSNSKEITLPFKFCICCGKNSELKIHIFQYKQQNQIAQLSKLAGNGLDVFLDYALTEHFTVNALFCSRCGKRIDNADFIAQLGHLIFVLIIFATLILSMTVNSYFGLEESLYALGLGILIAIGYRVCLRFYKWKYFPKIKSIDNKFVSIKIPGQGKTKFSRT